jgi:hypothetical protein
MTHPRCVYTALDSSLLTAAAYVADGTLMLQFRSGAIYAYFAIPPAVFHHLIRRSIQRCLL